MLLSSLGQRASRWTMPAVFIGLALATSGCASKTQSRTYAQVDLTSYDRLGKKPEIEADGLPVQTPPLRRAEPQADDPREPFSPNYGKVGYHPTTAPYVVPVKRGDLDDEAIVAQAILAHEQRYR